MQEGKGGAEEGGEEAGRDGSRRGGAERRKAWESGVEAERGWSGEQGGRERAGRRTSASSAANARAAASARLRARSARFLSTVDALLLVTLDSRVLVEGTLAWPRHWPTQKIEDLLEIPEM